MKELKAKPKVTQAMTRDGLTLENKATGEVENISSREAEQDYTPEAGGTAEKLLERANDAHDRHKAKKTAKQAEATAAEGEAAEKDPEKTRPFDMQLEALLPVLSDEALDFNDRDTVFDACKAKAEELGKKNGWLLYPLGIALSGKQRTPGGGTDLACMMGREKTLERVKAAIEKLNG